MSIIFEVTAFLASLVFAAVLTIIMLTAALAFIAYMVCAGRQIWDFHQEDVRLDELRRDFEDYSHHRGKYAPPK